MGQHSENQIVTIRQDDEAISFIPEDLRRIVLRILKRGSSAKGLVSTKRLYEAAERGDPYFVASAVYDFLWKQVTSESRKTLYPVVGDFFLTALEQKLGQIGPNNMSSRFAELMECYTISGDVERCLEGPLYCADMFLLKTTQLVLGGDGSRQEQDESGGDADLPPSSQFLEEQKLTLEDKVQQSLQLARDALLDGQKTLAGLGQSGSALEPRYVEFIRSTMDRLTSSWQQWNEMHQKKSVFKQDPEEYFREGIGRAEKVNSLVLAAMLLEQASEEYQDKMCRVFLNHRFSDKPADHPSRGCIFDAGEIYRDQGIVERGKGAYLLSERRFTRAISLFGQIRDRTSTAQTLIERARVYIFKKAESWRAHDDLHRAAQNIAAHQKRLPPDGPLPELTPEQVLYFFEKKGLAEEARAYKAHDPSLVD